MSEIGAPSYNQAMSSSLALTTSLRPMICSILERGEDRRGARLKGCGDGTGVDMGQPLQARLPGKLPGQAEAVCRGACCVQRCRCHGRRPPSDVALGERDPFICKVTGDLVTPIIVADESGESDVVT